MYTPGTLLRLAREERKLSLHDTKLIIKIRESALHAMETDQYNKFPTSYMQTFLPEYVQFLGIPPKKIADAMKFHFPEHEQLASLLTMRAAQQRANEEGGSLEYPFVRAPQTFFRRHAGKLAVAASLLAFALFGGNIGTNSFTTELRSAVSSVFAKTIVATPEEMRGSPFSEITEKKSAIASETLTSSAVPSIESTPAVESVMLQELNKIRQMDAEQRTTVFDDAQASNDAALSSNEQMKVISLAAIVPMQQELQHALEEGFDAVMRDEKTEARMRRKSTPVASVSLSAAKVHLEKNGVEEVGEFNGSDAEERDESEQSETTSEASIEALRKTSDAASAKIHLILETHTALNAAKRAAALRATGVYSTERSNSEVFRGKRHVALVEVVELQGASSLQTIEIALPKSFTPIVLPIEYTGMQTVNADLAQN